MVSLKNIAQHNVGTTYEDDVMNDVRYVCKSCALITELLKKGCDVMQLVNGDIISTELKAVTFHYSWNEKKKKLLRVYAASRSKKFKNQNMDNEFDDEELEFHDDLEMV